MRESPLHDSFAVMLTEPRPSDPTWPRYSNLPFPQYHHVPGLNPRPRGSRGPHHTMSWNPENWRSLTPYLCGIDLYNYAYWWECHETLEQLWRSAEKTSVQRVFLQGIIQIAAANLNRHIGKRAGSIAQAEKGLARLDVVRTEAPTYMGIDLNRFVDDARRYFSGKLSSPAVITLIF